MTSSANLDHRGGQISQSIHRLSSALPKRRPEAQQVQPAKTVPLLVDGMALPYSQRIIVIVPGVGIDYYALANRLWILTNPDHRQILLMGLFDRDEYEFQARRNLTTLAAATRDDGVLVCNQIVKSKDIIETLSKIEQTGDLVLIPYQMKLHRNLSRINLAEKLAEDQSVPVYGLDLGIEEDRSWFQYRVMDFVLLVLAMLSVVAVTGVLIWLQQASDGGIRTVLQILALVIEVKILWAISNTPH